MLRRFTSLWRPSLVRVISSSDFSLKALRALASRGDKPKQKTEIMNMRKICAMIKVKYYDHNQKINYPLGAAVQLYDPHDRLMGEMTLKEAMSKAHSAKLDLVMRNSATDPATVKLMDYKREVFRKLLMRLGKRFAEEEEKKKKFLVLSSSIKSHDLHNRIKVAHNILKKNSILQVFMPIDVVNDESVNKGRLIMKTFMAELGGVSKIHKDLKELKEVPDSIFRYSQKLMTGVEGQEFQDRGAIERYLKENYSSPDKQRMYLLVELLSTVNEKDFDIQTILETQTLDEFLESMYKKEPAKETKDSSSRLQARKMMKEAGGRYTMAAVGDEDEPAAKLDFMSEDLKMKQEVERERLIAKQAIKNIRKQREVKKKSPIFGGGKNKQQVYIDEEGMDLTQDTEEQALLNELESALETKDSFSNSEIFAAKFEELDAPSRRRLYNLSKKLQYEEVKMKIAYVLELAKKNKAMFQGPQ